MYEHLGLILDFSSMIDACTIAQCDDIKKLCMILPNTLKAPWHSKPSLLNLSKIDPNAELINRDDTEKCYDATSKFYG